MSTHIEGIGIEDLVDEVEFVLRENLNVELARQDEIWAPKDEARATARGVQYVPIVCDPVDPSAFFAGNIPSLVKEEGLMLEDYPYVSIVPGDAAPDAEDARHDQLRVIRNQLSIHAIAKASPAEGPEFAFRRSVRMAEAIYATVLGHPSLKRKLQGISNPARVQVSEPFPFNPQGLPGGDAFWQAAGTQYAVKNYTMAP